MFKKLRHQNQNVEIFVAPHPRRPHHRRGPSRRGRGGRGHAAAGGRAERAAQRLHHQAGLGRGGVVAEEPGALPAPVIVVVVIAKGLDSAELYGNFAFLHVAKPPGL